MIHFKKRRIRLIEEIRMRGGGAVIISNASLIVRSGDTYYPYRHDNYFYYLSGFSEPEAVILLIVNQDTSRSILFCNSKKLEQEIWHEDHIGLPVIGEKLNFEEVLPMDISHQKIGELLVHVSTIFCVIDYESKWNKQLCKWLKIVHNLKRKNSIFPFTFIDVRVLLDEFRLFKDANEINIMRQAAAISTKAHCSVMQQLRHGSYEYQLEAELLYVFRKHGAQFPAYNSIVATGYNACILHHCASDTQLKNGDLVLIDAGCEFESYASDITRTVPVNGKFSYVQKELYEIVLMAQEQALKQVKPGKSFIDAHNVAVRILAQGMLDVGLLDSNKVGTLDDVIMNGDYQQFYMHNTSHWIGMDVHDVGGYYSNSLCHNNSNKHVWRILEPGMVLTVEPGIYVRPATHVPEKYWNIGIRIEDSVHVILGGQEVLTSDVPKTIIEIEAVMNFFS